MLVELNLLTCRVASATGLHNLELQTEACPTVLHIGLYPVSHSFRSKPHGFKTSEVVYAVHFFSEDKCPTTVPQEWDRRGITNSTAALDCQALLVKHTEACELLTQQCSL